MEEVVRRQNRFLRKVVTLSAAGVFLDGYDLFIISVVLIFIEAQNWVSTASTTQSYELGLLASSAFMGMFVGALFVGRYADRVGRRLLYIIDLIFFIFFGLLTAFATNVVELIIFRFLLGIGIGADYPVSSTYVAEFSPKHSRGKLISTTFMFWGIGSIIAALVGFTFGRFEYIPILGHNIDSWRIMLASGVIPAVIVLFLRHTMPESPRWLLANSQKEKANKIIEEIKEKYYLDYSKDFVTIEPERRGRVSELFSKAYRKRTLFSWIPWFFMDTGVYGVGIFIPVILKTILFPGSSIVDKIDAIEGTIFFDIFILVGFVVAVFVIEKLGRVRLQEIGFAGMAITALFLSFTFNYGIVVIFVALALYEFFENVGPNVTTWIVPTEIFPTRLRATAQGTSSAFSRLGAILGTFSFPVIAKVYGWDVTFFVVFGFMVLGLVFTRIFAIEPKGLALEDSATVFLEFSEYLRNLGGKVREGAVAFMDMIERYDNLVERAEAIKTIEHDADGIVHEIYTKVNLMSKPLESVDVGMLATKLDDILDFINATAKRVALFKVPKTPEMEGMARTILDSVEEVYQTFRIFGNLTESDFVTIREQAVKINEMENRADDQLASSYDSVFKIKDPVELIKLKEVYEYMETVTDKCEDIADIFMDLVIKYS